MTEPAPRRRTGRLRRGAAWAAGVLLLVFAGLQLVSVERANPPVVSDVNAPPAIDAILRKACYDCHSHETRWPWYSRVAPMSWWIADHVREGREDLNFSDWPTFDFELQRLAFEDIRKQIKSGAMPLESYRLAHPEARLTEAERAELLRWATLE
jgi:hypothetical protein